MSAVLLASLALFAASPQAPQPVVIQDAAQRIELRLPAPYWQYHDRQGLAAQAGRGCAARRLPPNLLFAIAHKDAPASLWCELVPKRFLMRNKDDLETFLNGFSAAVQAQVGVSPDQVQVAYQQRGAVVVHRLEFSAPVRTGGGCSRPSEPAEDAPKVHYVIQHVLVRPEQGDALAFKLICAAPQEAFEELRPEIDSILASARFTGPLAQQFFVPDAPPEKVLDAKDAARMAGVGKAGYGWLLLIAAAVGVWLLLRRKQPKAAG